MLLRMLLMLTLAFGPQAKADEQPITAPRYKFNSSKVKEAKTSFLFLRAFVDYFYHLANANRANWKALPGLLTFHAWCGGDVHPENFGTILLSDGTPIFALNDYDDSGPCPAVLDFFRLLVSARLQKSEVDIQKLVLAYLDGLENLNRALPRDVEAMIAKARKKGTAPKPSKVAERKFRRLGPAREVSSETWKTIEQVLVPVIRRHLEPGAKILDIIATSAVGGGSDGMLRYEALIQNGGTLLHLELKEQEIPSIYPVAEARIPATEQRLATTLKYVQGNLVSPLYQILEIEKKKMLLRPRFAANSGVDLGSLEDPEAVIQHEAYLLGLLHTQTLPSSSKYAAAMRTIPKEDWEADVGVMTRKFHKKHKEVGFSVRKDRAASLLFAKQPRLFSADFQDLHSLRRNPQSTSAASGRR